MDREWQDAFRRRMHRFEERHTKNGGIAVSIKIRVSSGCFHREHSPEAFAVINRKIRGVSNADFDYVEHESGPELLVYLAVGTAGLTLAKSLIDLTTTIIKARSEGIKKGDNPSEPLELIVRRSDERNGFKEDVVLRIGHTDPVNEKVIEARLKELLDKLNQKKSTNRSSRE